MTRWVVEFEVHFEAEFDDLPNEVQDELLAMGGLLEVFGPTLGRPHADTLGGSRYSNMKELRFRAADGVWRVAFDPARRAILLVAGDKNGMSEKRFYRRLIRKADKRYGEHLRSLSSKPRNHGKDA